MCGSAFIEGQRNSFNAEIAEIAETIQVEPQPSFVVRALVAARR
jgi:hypothetical protein